MALRKQCDFAHYPSLTYEILAHMMKHGFLDAVINFNFDELLDQAIEAEVGAGRYIRIVRDGDFNRELRIDQADQKRFDRPLYIKPHGTVSDPASLRFTREAYFAIPPDTTRLLKSLICGTPADKYLDSGLKNTGSKGLPVCILVLGHALESFEFNKLFLRWNPENSMYVTKLKQDSKKISKVLQNANIKSIVIDNNDINNSGKNGLQEFMEDLWKIIAIKAKPPEGIDVRGIQRHKLISGLFRPTDETRLMRAEKSNSSKKKLARLNYFKDRFLVESMLSIAKARGFVNLGELNRGRAGHYFTCLREAWEEMKPGKLRESSPIDTIDTYLKGLGMVRRDPSRRSYWHESLSNSPGRKALTESEFRGSTRATLLEACTALLSKNRKVKILNLSKNRKDKKLNESMYILAADTLDAMFDGADVEVVPGHLADFQFDFSSVRPVHSFAHLRSETSNLVKGEYDVLVCVAESGEWLLYNNEIVKDGKALKSVGVIVADPTHCVALKKAGMKVMQLPWHQHNRHMTISLNVRPDTFEATMAIYFERRHRSSRISPVVLENESDLKSVMQDLAEYWLKAERHMSGLSDEIILPPDQVEKELVRILNELKASTCISCNSPPPNLPPPL